MKFSALATASALILTTVSGSAWAANLVVNGSFETGDFTGYTVGGTTGDAFPPSVITYNSPSSYPTGAFGEAVPPNNSPNNSPDAVGNHAAYFVSDFAKPETLSQAVFLTAGIYQVGFSAYLPANGFGNAGDAMFTGSIAGLTLASFAASSSAPLVWQSFQGFTNILADGLYQVDFSFNTNQNPSKDVVIDQVYIIAGNPTVPVPEPVSLSLLGAGLIGLGLARRKRG